MEQLLTFVSEHVLMSVLWLGLLLALAVSTVQSSLSKVKSVTPQQATLLVNRENGAFVDIRSADEYRKGHVQGSVHLIAEKIRNKEVASLEKYRDAPIVVVCATGLTSKGVANELHKQGFTRATAMQGGISSWQSASLPLSKK